MDRVSGRSSSLPNLLKGGEGRLTPPPPQLRFTDYFIR